MAAEAVRAASAFDRLKTSAPHRNLRPLVAGKNMWRRIAALDALQRFRHAYADARRLFVAGHGDVLVPVGRFALRRFGGAIAPA